MRDYRWWSSIRLSAGLYRTEIYLKQEHKSDHLNAKERLRCVFFGPVCHFLEDLNFRNESFMLTRLSLLFRQLHVVEDPEDDAEQILPPVFLIGVAVCLHHLKHHRQTPDKQNTNRSDEIKKRADV